MHCRALSNDGVCWCEPSGEGRTLLLEWRVCLCAVITAVLLPLSQVLICRIIRWPAHLLDSEMALFPARVLSVVFHFETVLSCRRLCGTEGHCVCVCLLPQATMNARSQRILECGSSTQSAPASPTSKGTHIHQAG